MEKLLMKVGLLADTHDRVPAIRDLLNEMINRGVTLVMHAGDYCSPFALEPFHETNVALLGIFGRNDGDHEGLRAAAARGMGMELYESPHSFEVSGHRIMIVHDIGEVNRRSIESHSFVVHGFTHRQETIARSGTIVVNPGEGCGWISGACTAAILDLETREVEVITI
ncbi:MAG: YfcE family phosphodiesterase [Gemmatimonadaceae bacterium]|nr:YfcE family phosphodiesterase [Gemmatimonadaceae bacterium]